MRLGQDKVEEGRVSVTAQETRDLDLGDIELLTRSRQTEISSLCANISSFWRSVARELDCNEKCHDWQGVTGVHLTPV